MIPANIFLKHMPRFTKTKKVNEVKKQEFSSEEQALVKELRELQLQTEARKLELQELRFHHVGIF